MSESTNEKGGVAILVAKNEQATQGTMSSWFRLYIKKENLINGIVCDKVVDRRHKKRIHLVTKPSDVWLHRDGRVHEISFLGAQKSSDRVSDGKTC